MSNLPQKLLGHPPLLEGEALASFLIRLRKANFYRPPSILTELICDGASKNEGQIFLPRRAGIFERMARLAPVECRELYEASAHRFTGVISFPELQVKFLDLAGHCIVPLLPEVIVTKLLRPTSACQYCPLCVQQHPYHRLGWVPIAASACIEHKCLLVNQCYNCSRPLHVQDIVNTSCSNCGADPGKAPCIHIRDDEFGILAQQVIQGLLFNNPLSLPNNYQLPMFSARALYQLINGLRSIALRLAKSGWAYLHALSAHHDTLATPFKTSTRNTLTPYQSYCLYATAFKGVVHWPKGFYEFLDAHYSQDSNGIHASLQKALGTTYLYWLEQKWQYEEFDFVQDAFNRYVTERFGVSISIMQSGRIRRTPELLSSFTVVGITYAAQIANVSTSTIRRVIRAGHLKTTQENPTFVKQADVLKLRDAWNYYTGLEHTAQVLGVSDRVVLDMVNIGLLTAEQSPTTGFLAWKFNEKNLYQLLDKIKSHTRVYDERGRANSTPLGLVEASRILMPIDINAALIVASVADGKLQAHRRPGSQFSCQHLLFERCDLDAYIEVVKAERGWMSQKDVAKRLKKDRATLLKWVRAGLFELAAVSTNAQFFDKAAVEKFAADYITSEEAAMLLGIGKLAVQRWVRQDRLKAISGPGIDDCHDYLFDRESLLQWRHGRLSFGEALEILGVGGSTLRFWVQRGKIAPLDDMGGKQRWYSREAILRLNQEMEQKHAIMT